MTLPSGPSEVGPCFRTPGLPPISCPTIWQNFQQLKPLLLLRGFPPDRGPLSPYLTQDRDNNCPVTKKTGQSSIIRQDLPGGPKEFWSCFGQHGQPPILCSMVWQMLRQLQPPLIMGGFPMDHELAIIIAKNTGGGQG